MLMLLVSGCVSAMSDHQALCDGTGSLRDYHSEALVVDGGDLSVTTGATLLDALDRACQP